MAAVKRTSGLSDSRMIRSSCIFKEDPFRVREGITEMAQAGEKFDRINAIPAYQLVAEAIERENSCSSD